MKRLLLLLFLLPLFATAQNTHQLESGTSPVVPQFRYKPVSPDSLNHLWIYNPVTNEYNRVYTATEIGSLYEYLDPRVFQNTGIDSLHPITLNDTITLSQKLYFKNNNFQLRMDSADILSGSLSAKWTVGYMAFSGPSINSSYRPNLFEYINRNDTTQKYGYYQARADSQLWKGNPMSFYPRVKFSGPVQLAPSSTTGYVWTATDANGNGHFAPAGGGTVAHASNGLSLRGDTVQMGGTINKNTKIQFNTNNTTFFMGDTVANNGLRIQNNSTNDYTVTLTSGSHSAPIYGSLLLGADGLANLSSANGSVYKYIAIDPAPSTGQFILHDSEGQGLVGDDSFKTYELTDNNAFSQVGTVRQITHDSLEVRGIPRGGTTGQVLAKVDGSDYNVHWTTSGGTIPNALTQGFGINTFSFDGGTSGVHVAVDTSAVATPYYVNVVSGPDGIVSGLVTTVASPPTAVTTAGTYRLNNALVVKGSSTNTTIDAQDATLNRYDLIVGNFIGTFSVIHGTLAADAVEPDVPANTALIASIYIPAVGGTVTPTGGGSGKGTVTSVALSMPSSIFTVTGSPIKTSGTFGVTMANQTANKIFAGPSTGSAAAPTFRSLVTADLPTTAVTPGSYTSSNITVDATGRITAASNGSGGFSNPMTTTGDMIYSSSGSTPARLAIGGAHTVVHGGTTPSYSAIDLTSDVTGILPNANTTATSTPTASAISKYDVNMNLSANSFINGFSNTTTSGATTTLTVSSNYLQYFNGTSTQTVVLPVASTLVNGQQFKIVNNCTGSGTVTVQTSGGTVMQAMDVNTQLMVTVINSAGGTGLASWSFTYSYLSFSSVQNISIANIGTGVSNALLLSNPTLATNGSQQNSPAFTLTGNNFGTTPNASTPASFRFYVQAVQNGAGNYGVFHFQSNFGGSFSDAFSVTGDGSVTFAGTISAVGGGSTFANVTANTIGRQNAASDLPLQIQNNQTFTAAGTNLRVDPGTYTGSSGTYNVMSIEQTYNETSTANDVDLLLKRTETAIGSGTHKFISGTVGGTEKFGILNTGQFSTPPILTNYTVATLPAAGTAGRIAYVTDATAPTFLGALVGGGSTKTPVFDNGSAWVSY